MALPDDPTLDLWLAEALELDADEQAYLHTLNLAQSWRPQLVAERAPNWGALVFFGVIAAAISWYFVAPLLEPLLGAASRVGLGSIFVDALLGLAIGFSRTLFDIASNPALGLSQPLLATAALALLLWPRAKASFQGAFS